MLYLVNCNYTPTLALLLPCRTQETIHLSFDVIKSIKTVIHRYTINCYRIHMKLKSETLNQSYHISSHHVTNKISGLIPVFCLFSYEKQYLIL